MTTALHPAPDVLRVDGAGTIRIGSTRVTLDTLVAEFRSGGTPEQIAQDYPSLGLAEIYNAIGYYLTHQQEMDEYLRRRDQQAEEFRGDHPGLFAQGVRERLLARQARQRSA